MKILRNSKRQKNITIGVIGLIVIVLGALAFAYYYHVFPFKPASNTSTNLDPATQEQKNAGVNVKKENNSPINSAKNDSDQSTSSPLPAGSEKQSVSVTINSANQAANGDLNVRSVIGTIDSNSTCTLKITTNGQDVYTETVNTFPQSSYTACGGFTIEKSKLNGATGAATLTVTYQSDNYQGTASKEIILQ